MPTAVNDHATTTHCFHCGLPCNDSVTYQLTVLDEVQSFCCPGCKAVTETIINAGMVSYYSHREAGSPGFSPSAQVPEVLSQLRVWDDPALQSVYVRESADAAVAQQQQASVTVMISGISCAACVWLIEHQLQQQPGISKAKVNLSNHRAEISWDKSQLTLSDILRTITKVGYKAEPYNPHIQEQTIVRENRRALARIGVAGLGTMQVMMFAVGLYAGAFQGIAAEYETFLRWVSALVCLPVYLYAGMPFLRGAWRNIKTRHLGMDVPVALAITFAYIASLWSTWQHGPEVYFDSVCMFVFFLSVGRYLEMSARHAALSSSIRTSQQSVSMARITTQGQSQLIPADQLKPGDLVFVKAGEAIPGDGTVIDGETLVNEAMLTGESKPVEKKLNDHVTGGTINHDQPISIKITTEPKNSVLSTLQRLLDQAQTEKPGITQLADKIAGVFVFCVLLIALLTYTSWHFVEPHNAFWITLAVLVVTCPCALSLATPTAITTATSRLANQGFLPTNSNFIESLHQVTDVVFDKTGTLTYGKFSISDIILLGQTSTEQARLLAASLEQHSEHPLAAAFSLTDSKTLAACSSVNIVRNQGVEACIDNIRYRIGTAEFASDLFTQDTPKAPDTDEQLILLSNTNGPIAWFKVADNIRKDARPLINYLQKQGLVCHILSGDHSSHPQTVANELGITQLVKGATPSGKLQHIKQLQQLGKKVLMIGDGLNDAPVLAGANVSIALSSGTDLAKVAADAVLLNHQISSLTQVIKVVRKTYQVIKQNLIWAAGYNLLALPAAALGFVPPWLAAIGMSLSSLVVVMNALRIKRQQ